MALKDMIVLFTISQYIVLVETFFTIISICFHFIKEVVTIDDRGIDINNHITINNTTLVTATIDVSTNQTTLHIIFVSMYRIV